MNFLLKMPATYHPESSPWYLTESGSHGWSPLGISHQFVLAVDDFHQSRTKQDRSSHKSIGSTKGGCSGNLSHKIWDEGRACCLICTHPRNLLDGGSIRNMERRVWPLLWKLGLVKLSRLFIWSENEGCPSSTILGLLGAVEKGRIADSTSIWDFWFSS